MPASTRAFRPPPEANRSGRAALEDMHACILHAGVSRLARAASATVGTDAPRGTARVVRVGATTIGPALAVVQALVTDAHATGVLGVRAGIGAVADLAYDDLRVDTRRGQSVLAPLDRGRSLLRQVHPRRPLFARGGRRAGGHERGDHREKPERRTSSHRESSPLCHGWGRYHAGATRRASITTASGVDPTRAACVGRVLRTTSRPAPRPSPNLAEAHISVRQSDGCPVFRVGEVP